MSHAGQPCVRCGFLPISHRLGTPGACHRYEKPASPALKALTYTLDRLNIKTGRTRP